MAEKLKKTICLMLSVMLLVSLAGCNKNASQDEPPPEEEPEPEAPGAISVTDYDPQQIGDNVFTLVYDPDQPMNPITGTNSYNLLACQLMYEPLFSVDSQGKLVNILCTEYSTEDGKTFDFKLREGVSFHDGTELTATDVYYTYSAASQSGRFVSRLRNVSKVGAPDKYTFRIVLSETNYDLPYLLDVPIIKYHSIDENIPQGCGPYEYTKISSSDVMLKAYTGYRTYEDLPIGRIMLRSVAYEDINMEFASSQIDLLQYDPTADYAFSIQADHELLYYPTTVLDYIGFNTNSISGSNMLIRRAVSYAIDRQEIVEQAYSGHASATSIPFQNYTPYYDDAAAYGNEFSLKELSKALKELGMEDFDGDSYLEYPYGDGTTEFTLLFVVNEENSARVRAAEMIAYTLGTIGVNVTLEIYPWAHYLAVLEAGEYDMFIGEVRLTPDFDLTQLLTKNGSLNIGGADDIEYELLINSFKSAGSAESKKRAATALVKKISQSSHIIPILFKENVVAVHRNTVKGINANQSYIFHDLDTWAIYVGKE